MRESTKKYLIDLAIAFGFSAGSFCLAFFLKGDYSFRGISDALFFSSMFVFLCLILYLLVRTGIFDMFAFTMNAWWQNMRSHPAEQWNSAAAYAEYQKGKRRKNKFNVSSFVLFGFLYLIASIVFLLIYTRA